MGKPTINEIIRQILFKHRLKTTELARLTGVPQQTLQRIVVGKSTKPHTGTLQLIADHFGYTLEQLMGIEVIPGLDYLQPDPNEPHWLHLPLLTFDVLPFWSEMSEVDLAVFPKIYTQLTSVKKAFAVQVGDHHAEPLFPKDTLLVVQDFSGRLLPQQFVLVSSPFQENTILVRQVIVGKDRSMGFKAISALADPNPVIPMRPDSCVYGTILYARRDYTDRE